MPHDLTPRRPSPAAVAAKSGRRRFVVVRQRGYVRGRPGIVLIFVVVLLTLLAIMGTAYLATSRIDRLQITGRGNLPGATTPQLRETRVLSDVQSAAEDSVKSLIIKDLFNLPQATDPSAMTPNQPFVAFRQLIKDSTYEDYDAPGRADRWLASLLPKRAAAGSTNIVWPWISGPLGTTRAGFTFEPFFSDPRYLTPTAGYTATFGTFVTTDNVEPLAGLAERNNASITAVQMLRSASSSPSQYGTAGPPWRNTRVYPAFTPANNTTGAAVTPAPAGTNTGKVIAGDADGDGIADSGLIPVALNPAAAATSIDRYLDRSNGVVYFVSYRVVDNSAKLNLATALTKYGDLVDLTIPPTSPTEYRDNATRDSNAEIRSFLATDPAVTAPAAGQVAPNYGFFRANVGMTELIRTLLSPLNQTGDSSGTATTGYLPDQAELRRFIDARFPKLKQNPGAAYDATSTPADGLDIEKLAKKYTGPAIIQSRFGTAAAASAQTAPTSYLYQYRSFGDLLETQVARRPNAPDGYLWTNVATVPPNVPPVDPDALPFLGTSNTISLSAKDGTLIQPLISSSTVEDALMFSTRLATPNVNNNGTTPWGWFPPDAVNLWFGWTKDFEPEDPAVTPPVITALDATTVADRAFHYAPTAGSGLADVTMPRSPRTLLTTYSGATTSVPLRKDFLGTAPGLPIGMPAYARAEARDGTHKPAIATSVLGNDPPLAPVVPNNLNAFWYPAAKVSAATGTKEQLWRAYWSAMTQMKMEVIGGLPVPRWSAAERVLNTAAPTAYDPDRQFDAFRTSDRHPSNEHTAGTVNDIPNLPTEVLTPRQMALIRSAVAACNTIDLRDDDNDITAMDVDITDDNAAADRLYTRVYGTEKQLVISGVYMEDRDTLTGTTDGGYVAIELYNPTDVPIHLADYRLTIVTHPSAGPLNKTSGTVDPGTTPVSIAIAAAATDVLRPGGYVVIETEATTPPFPTPAAYDPTGAPPFRGVYIPADNHTTTTDPQVYRYNSTTPGPVATLQFTQLLTLLTGADKELVLTRTRRDDAVPFVDGTAGAAGSIRATIENEVLAAPMTLVPVDAVDCRMGKLDTSVTDPTDPTTATLRLCYQRQVPGVPPASTLNSAATPLASAAAERANAWRCFYAGQFYDLRPTVGARMPATPIVGGLDLPLAEFAWHHVAAMGGYAQFAPSIPRVEGASRTAAGAFRAPPIPIQNFTPFDPYSVTPAGVGQYGQANVPAGMRGLFHLINKFPFGSPFARDGDLLAVPYIGTYKIYRSIGGATPLLYDYVPLTMDAVAVAPSPNAVATPGPGSEVKTVGRFDARSAGVGAAQYGSPTNGLANEWAANLTTFVSARQAPAGGFFPDVPDASRAVTYYTTADGTTNDQRWAQDGPVTGTGGANAYADVRWTTFAERDTATNDASLPQDTALPVAERRNLRRGELVGTIDDVPPLVQGLINVNTAPQIVLRQLPWLVHTAAPGTNGVVDAAIDPALRTYVNQIDTERTLREKAVPATAYDPATDPARVFGFRSVQNLAAGSDSTSFAAFTTQLITQPPVNTVTTPADLLNLGMLNPVNRNEQASNYLYDALNPTRVSNLATTRSDVFTVYVTVQAWTWVGGISGANQANDTRLIGERRSSFVVDRSRISQSQYDLSNLVVLPVERE